MWIELGPTLLKTHLTAPEIAALATVAKPIEVERILTDECMNVAEAWRGRIRKYHRVDRRDSYLPIELIQFALAHVRYSCFTRLPNMETLLDELRVKEWERANEIFDDPRKISISEPEEPEDPEVAGGYVPYIYENPLAWKTKIRY